VWSNSTVVRVDDGLILVDPGIDGADLNALADEIDRLGPPVIAIGGIDGERAARMREAGAYGVAAIGALWHAADPAAAALALLAPWLEDA